MTSPAAPAPASAALDPLDLLAIARRVALEAGELVARRRREGVSVAATKSSSVDVVTAADRESEALIRARLRELRPGDGFYGEESDPTASTTGVVWVVDPIDGTVNYLYGHADYAVSVAAVVGDPSIEPAAYDTLAGVVHAPAMAATFEAAAGRGAVRRDERTGEASALRVNDVTSLEQSLVATGFAYDPDDRRAQAARWASLAGEVRDIRRKGAASLDLCGVAEGTLDAYYESGTYAWDHAAGALVAREAGAIVSGAGLGDGTVREGRGLTVATAPGIAHAFRRLLAERGIGRAVAS